MQHSARTVSQHLEARVYAWDASLPKHCWTPPASTGTWDILFNEHGISFKDAKMDVATMIARKDKIVKQFTGGIAMLFKANKITPYYGFAQLQPGNVVKVKQHEGTEHRTERRQRDPGIRLGFR